MSTWRHWLDTERTVTRGDEIRIYVMVFAIALSTFLIGFIYARWAVVGLRCP